VQRLELLAVALVKPRGLVWAEQVPVTRGGVGITPLAVGHQLGDRGSHEEIGDPQAVFELRGVDVTGEAGEAPHLDKGKYVGMPGGEVRSERPLTEVPLVGVVLGGVEQV
jgi:hypothetical protein